MSIAALVLVAVLSAAAGAYGGRELVLYRMGTRHPRGLLLNAQDAAKRANVASAKAEGIAADWPDVLDRVERLSAQTARFIRDAQAAESSATESAARVTALELALAQNFNLTTSKGA